RAWPPSICSSARSRGSCWTRRTEIAVRRLARVDRVGVMADLQVNGVEVRRHRVELRADPLAVSSQKPEPLVLVAAAGPDQLGIAAHFPDRHARRPQFGDQLDPAQVALAVTTMARAGSVNPEHQPIALVVAQRVPR